MTFVKLVGALLFVVLVAAAQNVSIVHHGPEIHDAALNMTSKHEHSGTTYRGRILVDEPKYILRNESNGVNITQIESDSDSMVALNPGELVLRHKIDSGLVPRSRENIIVGNVGLANIVVEAMYGLKANWIGPVERITVKAKTVKVIRLSRPYYVTGVTFFNPDEGKRAFFFSYEEGHSRGNLIAKGEAINTPPFQRDIVKLMRQFVLSATRAIPIKGFNLILKSFIEEFWPAQELSAWDEVKDKVKEMLSDSQLDMVNNIIHSKLNEFQFRIKALVEETNGFNVSAHYMNIAEDMIGLDANFVFSDSVHDNIDLNFHSLPLYTRTVNLKIGYYTWGIIFAEKLGLDAQALERIKIYRRTTIQRAIKHVEKLNFDQQNKTYDTCEPKYFYNHLMKVRTFITVNGLEYIPYWKHILSPETRDVQSNYISYSGFCGRSSFNLNNQTIEAYNDQPLTPKLLPISPGSLQEVRNKLQTIKLFSCWNDKITLCSMQIFFENGDMYQMGRHPRTTRIFTVNLNGARIKKLRVGGYGAIDFIDFHLSDYRYFPVGKHDTQNFMDFEMEGHHITSIFVSNDVSHVAFQLVNLAVSYQLDPIHFTTMEMLSSPFVAALNSS